MTDFLLKEDGFFLLKEDGFKLIIDRKPPPIVTTIDLQYDTVSSTGVRDRVDLNYEFNRNISVNMK